MKNDHFLGVIRYPATGFIFGIILIFIGLLLNYNNGFHGPWFHIFDYAPDFVVIAFSPLFLSLIFYFIGFRREQLVLYNLEIKRSLSNEQIINTAADHQLKILAKVVAQLNEAIVISDGHGRVEWVNEGFTKTNGFSLDDVKGKELEGLLQGPLTNPVVAKRMMEKLIIGEAVVEELITYHKMATLYGFQ